MSILYVLVYVDYVLDVRQEIDGSQAKQLEYLPCGQFKIKIMAGERGAESCLNKR